MRRRIDAARQTGHDGETGFAQPARKNLRQLHAGRRRIARADHGDRRHGERRQMAAHRKQRRRIVDHLQALRIAGFADGDERDVEFSRGVHLTLSLVARTNLRRRRAAAPRQRGQGLKRRAGAAEMIDESAKRPRSDVLAADEAQPVEALLVGEVDAMCRFVHFTPETGRRSSGISPEAYPATGDLQEGARVARMIRYLLQIGGRTRRVAGDCRGNNRVPFGGVVCTVIWPSARSGSS